MYQEKMRMKRLAALSALAFTLAIPISAAEAQQPYAGFNMRPIKALSEQQIADLKAGRGMGLALAAELNGYPGPAHVLELAQSLALTEAQNAKVQELFAAMTAETVPIGEKMIAQEANLEREFAGKTITEASLTAAMQAIGTTQAALRAAHLKYHLATAKVLSATQVQRYAELRGYSSGPQTEHQHGGHQR
jgi:proteasome assembly chaperone (PAC2) family protein